MPLIVKRQWTRQPQVAARANSLFDAVLLPGSMVDAASGKRIALSGNAAFTTRTGGKAAVTAGGSTDFVSLAEVSSLLLSLTSATIIWHGRQTAAGQFGEFGNRAGIISARCGAHVPFTDGTVYWDFGGATSGATRLTAAGLTFSELDIWAFTTGPRGMEIWQNGILRASNAATPTRTTTDTAFGIGAHDTTASSNQTAAYAFAYSRQQFPAALLAQITASPTQLWGALFAPLPRRIWAPGAAAGGNTIAVPSGALTLSGLVPTVTATENQTIAVPAGALSLSAFAPTVTAANNQTIAVPAGTLTLSALVPTVTATANNSISVPAGALALSGFAPTVTSNASNTISVPAGSLSLLAYAPNVSTTTNYVSVPAGALTITGYVPAVSNGAASVYLRYFDVLSGKLLILRAL